MAEKTNEDLLKVAEEAEELQQKYNKDKKLNDEEYEKAAKLSGLTVEEVKEELEKGRLEEMESEKQEALEPSDEELQKEWEKENMRLTKLAEKGSSLSDEEIAELAEFYERTVEEIREDFAERESNPQENEKSEAVEKPTFFGAIIKAIKNIFN